MCTYTINLNDQLVYQVRKSFSDEEAMKSWLQRQVEELLKEFNTNQQITNAKARQAIEAMRKQSELNGNSELSLDEINNEIRMARRARKL